MIFDSVFKIVALVTLAVFSLFHFGRCQRTESADLCVGRCFDSYNNSNSCQCNTKCRQYNNCCPDFVPACVTLDSCRNRCIQRYNKTDNCHCNKQCTRYSNCCDDYSQECGLIEVGNTSSTIKSETSVSCTGRCNSKYNRNNVCQCNSACPQYNNCCSDYNQTCRTQPDATSPLSCRGRCNSGLNRNNPCQCNTACNRYNDCCSDYNVTCDLRNPTTSLSCNGRCDSKYNRNNRCQCNNACSRYKNCCHDYKALCEMEKYLCKGECNVTRSRCDCTTACVDAGNCCADYQETCLNKPAWKDEPCADVTELKCPPGFEIPPVILFSIDGFKSEYLYRGFTPNIHKLASCGVHVPYMRSVYPTSTFPNHYTIATGLYPESSGIIGNKMIDRELKKEFRLGSAESLQPYWWKGEPIWVTASNQGLKSATYFWPGSDVNITRYPDYYYKYDGSVDNEERIYQAFDWLDMPKDQRPSFMTLYISMLDSAGHKFGPNSQKLNKVLKEADDVVEVLMNGLRDRNLHNCVNLVLLADHGMSPANCSRMTSIEEFGLNADEYFVKSGAAGRVGSNLDPVHLRKYNSSEVYQKLRCRRDVAHWQAFLKEDFPKRFHYANNNRIEDVLILMDDTWLVEGKKGRYTTCDGGKHGYDGEYSSMHALFTAHGPGFKQNFNSTEPFENIEVYNLLTDLLEIKAAPNNGTKGSLYHVMRFPPQLNPNPPGVAPELCRMKRKGPEKQSEKHFPLGVPLVLPDYDSSVCILTHHDYVTVYDTSRNVSLSANFVLDRSEIVSTLQLSDVTSPQVTDDDVTLAYLFQPKEAKIRSNEIPMREYSLEIWKYMTSSLGLWAKSRGEIYVMVGLVYDYDYDGKFDRMETLERFGNFTNLLMPTHYYVIVTRCIKKQEKISTCASSPDDVEVISFVIPNYKMEPCHKNNSKPGQWMPSVVIENVARVRDIEILTGLTFFPAWIGSASSDPDKATAAIRIKTRLPLFTDEFVIDFLSPKTSGSAQLHCTCITMLLSLLLRIICVE